MGVILNQWRLSRHIRISPRSDIRTCWRKRRECPSPARQCAWAAWLGLATWCRQRRRSTRQWRSRRCRWWRWRWRRPPSPRCPRRRWPSSASRRWDARCACASWTTRRRRTTTKTRCAAGPACAPSCTSAASWAWRPPRLGKTPVFALFCISVLLLSPA